MICAGAAAVQSMLPNTSDAIRREGRITNGMKDPLDSFTRLQFVHGKADTVLEPAAEPGICSLTAFFLGYLP